ncbi:MAG TPA: LysE family translocator [Steroidobacteraceae bacterium]|nr:LysE family translocator [Steroidobacteraceae bacterium]
MLDIHHFALFAAAALLLVVTPGPDTLYVVSHATARGRRGGVIAALGIGAGCLLHILAATAGLSALLLASATAFALVRYAGAAYLVWVGIGLLRAPRRAPAAVPRTAPADDRRIFLGAALTNALNPKVALFFLAFLPQFVDLNGAHRAASLLVLGALFDAGGTLWLLIIALLAARAVAASEAAARAARWLGRATGAAFVALGLRLALVRD